MKQLLSLLAFCWLCSCNTIHVAQNKNGGNTPSVGVEWNFGDVQDQTFQHKIDSVMLLQLDRFNAQQHAFTVYQRKRRDKQKDYITIDFEKAKVVGTGGKIAGYSITAVGLAAPFALLAAEAPLLFGFYYWPNHNITSKVTLSPNLSDEKKNNKNLVAMTGALFASTDKQVDRLLQKYAEGFQRTLLDVETQLAQHR